LGCGRGLGRVPLSPGVGFGAVARRPDERRARNHHREEKGEPLAEAARVEPARQQRHPPLQPRPRVRLEAWPVDEAEEGGDRREGVVRHEEGEEARAGRRGGDGGDLRVRARARARARVRVRVRARVSARVRGEDVG